MYNRTNRTSGQATTTKGSSIDFTIARAWLSTSTSTAVSLRSAPGHANMLQYIRLRYTTFFSVLNCVICVYMLACLCMLPLRCQVSRRKSSSREAFAKQRLLSIGLATPGFSVQDLAKSNLAFSASSGSETASSAEGKVLWLAVSCCAAVPLGAEVRTMLTQCAPFSTVLLS